MVLLTPRTASWMPPSLLPSQSRATATTVLCKSGELSWRCHVREILAHDLPSAASLGREQWSGLLLKFTAMWSILVGDKSHNDNDRVNFKYK